MPDPVVTNRVSCRKRGRLATALMTGCALLSSAGVLADPHESGNWSPLITWPHVPSSVAVLPGGKLLTWSSNELLSFPDNGVRFSYSSVYDPDNGTFTTSNNPTHDMFCAGISLRSDGTVVAAGGNPQLQDTSVFNPATGAWQQGPYMNHERWYGTTLTLADDSIFATFARGDSNIPELLNGSGNWVELPDAAMTTLWNEQNLVNSGAVNNSVIAQWNANMQVAPDGRIFHAGPTRTMHWFDTTGSGSSEIIGARPGDDRHRQGDTFSLYDVGKMLMTGGSDKSRQDSATATAMTFDINGSSPAVAFTDSMIAPRVYHNAVVLPNGEVMIIGGNSSGILFDDDTSVLDTEIWSPLSGTFRTTAPVAVGRNYHSVAVLLKDGRVFSGGGGLCGNCDVNHPDAQIFDPPYLFNVDGSRATRPVINNAPAEIQARNNLLVSASPGVQRFNLLRVSSNTHSVNTDERLIPVSFSAVTETLYQLTTTSNPNVLLPGYYWLFALDQNGVPSIGRTLRVETGVAPVVPFMQYDQPAKQNHRPGDRVELQLQVSNQQSASPIQYSATGLPQGLTINPSTGLISGTLDDTIEQQLQSQVLVRGTDQAGLVTIEWLVSHSTGDGVVAGSPGLPDLLVLGLGFVLLRGWQERTIIAERATPIHPVHRSS